MKHFFLYLSIALFFGCKSERSQPNKSPKHLLDSSVSIAITPVFQDSLSIRALDYSNGFFWFAGSKGSYGKINNTHEEVISTNVTPNGVASIDFRSIAVTQSYTYLMTAGNPALIYRISKNDDQMDLVYTEVGDQVFYDSMKFWNDQEGIAFGDPVDNCLSVIMTKDAGATWNKVDCTRLPELITGEAAFAASNSNIVLQDDHIWLATGGAAARVIHSDDRGQSWTAYETPIVAGSPMSGIFAMDFYDQKRGIIIGGDWEHKNRNTNTKALTQDGGKTWDLIANGKNPGYCSDIIFIPDTAGQELLAVGSTGIWWSGNQGIDWQQISQEGFYTIHMTDKYMGYLAGKHKISRFLLGRH